MTLRSARNAYASAAVETVAPEKLLIMLFDALVRNLVQAEAAIDDQNSTVAHEKLIVAQDIVGELISSLNPDGFEGGQQLLGLYTFMYGELIDANLNKSKAKVMGVRSLVEPLAETWRQAATTLAESGPDSPSMDSISVAG
ncbi:flagellar export chaperone FliS [Stomatohabitans albus]|uniref:flagellar export chaperone FliS n=1 Tax=Stomatohabitans albus TaxID=3110766 RepID=UPI00300C581B